MIKEYELIEYDVWGNARDGYEVNQAFTTGQFYDIDPDWSNEQLIKYLKSEGLLKKSVRKRSIKIDGDKYALYFTHTPTGRPGFELRLKQ